MQGEGRSFARKVRWPQARRNCDVRATTIDHGCRRRRGIGNGTAGSLHLEDEWSGAIYLYGHQFLSSEVEHEPSVKANVVSRKSTRVRGPRLIHVANFLRSEAGTIGGGNMTENGGLLMVGRSLGSRWHPITVNWGDITIRLEYL